MRNKTIALVANSTWNIYNFRLSLIRRLRSEGYQVLVIAPVDKYIHYLNDSGFTRHIPLRYLSAHDRSGVKDLLFTWELVRILRRERPDLVINFTIKPNIFGNIAARWAGVSAISIITGLGYPFLHRGLAYQLVPWLYRLAFRRVHKVVFYNPDDREVFLRRQIVSADNSVIIPGSGVNTNHFRPLTQPDNEKFIFLFIGRLLFDKGLAEYVEAARQLRHLAPQAECWVIGELNSNYPKAVNREQMLDWIAAKNIRYFGEAQDVRKYIKQAHVVVLPSYREGIPRSLLEAMAMCKPILTTDTAGCRETVHSERNGRLVPIRDSQALAEMMLQFYLSPAEELEKMGYYSRQRVLNTFDDKQITEQFSKLIAEVLQVQALPNPLVPTP